MSAKMSLLMNTKPASATATFANLKQDPKQEQQQPRFIRKKPQVISSIEHFSEELKTVDQVQTSPEQQDSPQSIKEGVDTIQQMMEELKRKKLAEIMYVKPVFPDVEENFSQNNGGGASSTMMAQGSPRKTKEINITFKSNEFNTIQPQISMSPEQRKRSKSKGRKDHSGQSLQTLEELKQKKLEELTQMLIQEQRSSRQSFHAIMSQPYTTTVTHQGQITEEEDCPSESTVQYHLNESVSAAKTQKSASRRMSPARAPSPQSQKSILKQQLPPPQARPKSALGQQVQYQGVNKVNSSKVTAIKEQVQQTKKKLNQVTESRKKQVNQQIDIIDKKQFSTQAPPFSLNKNVQSSNVSRNQQQKLQSQTKNREQFKTTTQIAAQPIQTCQQQRPQSPNSNKQLSQLEFYNDPNQRSTSNLAFQTPKPSSSLNLSDKTMQIMFKKLQKDCENAIREADREDKGTLTMDQLKTCLFLMHYLPFMQVEEQEKMSQQQVQALFGNRQYHASTNKSLIMQEKEFVYNFWCIVNPLNNTEIDNALIYDVLLLMIYNVQQTLQITTKYLEEYFETYYREMDIDIDQFANFHSGNSNGRVSPRGSGDLSNLNKYLSYCNLWSIERFAFEFRQIHANRISRLFSNSQNPKRDQYMTSFSPKGELLNPNYSQNVAKATQSILLNPSDGRKYKKTVVEEHLSNMTFSPKINQKTNQLDQRLIHRLMTKDNSNSQNRNNQIKRDSSVDALLNQALGRNLAANWNKSQNFTLNLEPIDANGIFKDSCPQFKRYDLLLYRQQMAQNKIGKAIEDKQNQMMEECTFHPNLRQHSPVPLMANIKSYQHLKNQADKVFYDITQRVKTQRSKLLDPTLTSTKIQNTEQMSREEKELENCTFHPKINKVKQENESIIANQQNLPKGYYEMINRMRKVNEEKRAMEEKIQKKAIGENYDKVKLMNSKPPSFVDGERPKKKLIMYIDVNITPTRTGRIGIYEGDDVKELAKNFKKTFQLNSNMQALLTQQLEYHLQLYKERNGMGEIQGSIFPPESNLSPEIDQHLDNNFYMMNSRGGFSNLRQPISSSSSQTFDGMNIGRPTRSAYLLANIDEEESKSLQEQHQSGYNQNYLELDEKQYMPLTLTNELRQGTNGLTFGQIFDNNRHKSYQQKSPLLQNDAHFFQKHNQDGIEQSSISQLEFQQQHTEQSQQFQRLSGSSTHRRVGADQLESLIASDSERQRQQIQIDHTPGFFAGTPVITDFQQYHLMNNNKNESFF